MPEIKPTEVESAATIKVVGVGGAGGSAINRMKESGVMGVEFIAINTDSQALHNSDADIKVNIGKGLGAGGDPERGRLAAEDSKEQIAKVLEGADMVFITFGAGGGTGSGSGPVVAREAKELGILTVGVVTKPFTYEGPRRMKIAEQAVAELSKNVDALVTIPNDRIIEVVEGSIEAMDSFGIIDDVLRQGVQGISDMITGYAEINLDFADVEAVMKNAGSALMGIGRASGEDRAIKAAQEAIGSPLIEVKIDGAKGILYSIASGVGLKIDELKQVADVIMAGASPDAIVNWGMSIRPELGDDLIVTVVATGFDSGYYPETPMATTPVIEPAMEESIQEESEVKPKASNGRLWESLKRPEVEEDLEVPPALRDRYNKDK